MATPSVLTVPSMYGDGILYSGPTVFSNELVTNGNFQTDSDWTKGTGWTISNGIATLTTHTTSSSLNSTAMTVTSGHTYKIEVDVVSTSSGFRLYDTIGVVSYGLDVGKNIFYRTVSASSYTIIPLGLAGATGSIDSVSVKEVIQGSDFDFTRDTSGTRINEEGYIEDVPYNLAFYSEDISQWDNFRVGVQLSNIISPLNSTSVYLLEDGAQTDNHYRKLDYATLDPNNTYTQSFFVKKKDNGIYPVLRTSGIGGDSWVTFNWDTETLVQGSQITSSKVEKLNAGWYRISMVFSGLASTGFIIGMSNDPNDDLPTYTGNFNRFYAWGCQIVKGDKIKNYLPTTDRVNLPRLNYPVYGGCPSLLLEPQRTNNVKYSNDFLQSDWGGTQGLSVTLSNAISPEGILNAATVTQDGTDPNPALATNASILTGQIYTFSMFVKNVNLNGFVRLSHVTSGSTGCWFNLDDGTIGTVNSQNATIKKYKNGWYRITNTFVSTTGGNSLLAFLGLSDTDGTTALTGSNQSVLAYGAQLELGSYATSLIHTSGGTFTRNEDRAFDAGLGTTDTFNDSEGVLYAEISVLDTDSANKMITLSNGTNSTRVLIRYVDTTLLGQLRISGSNQYEFAYTLPNMTDNLKIAIKYKVNDFSFYVNGTQLNSSNSGNVFSSGTLTELAFDDGGGSNIFNGNVKAVAVYKTALTDTELANLTSYNNHDLFIPYRSRMQMISADQELQCTEHDITRFL